MASVRDFISLNIARFNRLRRKPVLEILTFMIKRTKLFWLHLRDRLRIVFGEIRLGDTQFFDKLSLKGSSFTTVKEALVQEDLEKAKMELIAHMRGRNTPSFFFDRTDKKKIIEVLEDQFPQSKGRTVDLAEEFANHKFRILGKSVFFKGPINWHSSLSNGREWPLTFSPSIDYFSSKRVGDIKLAWELNRTQHFVTLGKAYWYTGNEKYATEFTDQLLSWIKENPYKLGINWMEGIEIAVRLYSWVWAYYFFLDSEKFNEKAHFEFLKSVYMQTKFVEEHLSDKWRINGNHLIAEANVLTLIGILFPEFSDADKWRKKGIEVLERELKAQILPDGVTWEHSTGYQKFVTDLCLFVAILMTRNGMKIPETILSALDQMTNFLDCVAKADGHVPLVGDEDQGKVIGIDEIAYDDIRPTVTIGSIACDKKAQLNAQSEQAFWLLGTEALVKKSGSHLQTSRLFKDSGFMVMRDIDKYLLFVTGPQDPKYLHASHRHLDMLSIILEAYETYFLVDPGTYTYFGDFSCRKYFKSSKGHNTVVVDDEDPVNISEAFELSHIPFAQIQDYAIGSTWDWISASHNGYGSINHSRQIFFVKPQYWLIVDLLQGEGEHVYDLYFHFNSGLDLVCDKTTGSITAIASKGSLKVVPLMTPGLDLEISDGEISPRYGMKVEAPVLRYRKKTKSPATFLTVLHPYLGDEPDIRISEIDVYAKDHSVLDCKKAIGAKIDFGKTEHFFVCSQNGEQCLSFEDFRERDARIAFLRKYENKLVEEVVL